MKDVKSAIYREAFQRFYDLYVEHELDSDLPVKAKTERYRRDAWSRLVGKERLPRVCKLIRAGNHNGKVYYLHDKWLELNPEKKYSGTVDSRSYYDMLAYIDLHDKFFEGELVRDGSVAQLVDLQAAFRKKYMPWFQQDLKQNPSSKTQVECDHELTITPAEIEGYPELDPELFPIYCARFGNLAFNDIRIIGGWNPNTEFYFHHEQEKITLPEDLRKLEEEWRILADEKRSIQDVQDYPVYAITDIRNHLREADATRVFDFSVKDATNFNRHAVSLSLDTILPPPDGISVRQKYFQKLMAEPEYIDDDFLSPFFGVNLNIITSDGRVALSKKRSQFASTEKEKLHFGLGLAMRPFGSDTNLDVVEFAERRLKLSFSLTSADIRRISFYAVNFSSVHCGYAAYGYARLNITFEELMKSQQSGAMRDHFHPYGMPYHIDGIKEFMVCNNHPQINQYSLFGALSCLHLFDGVSFSTISRAFSDPQWQKFSKTILESKIEFGLEEMRRL